MITLPKYWLPSLSIDYPPHIITSIPIDSVHLKFQKMVLIYIDLKKAYKLFQQM